MSVRIASKEFGILAILIVSLLLCSITSTDPADETSANSRSDKDNQTTIDEPSSQSLTDDGASDSQPETVSPESVSILENNVTVPSTENKSELLPETTTTANLFVVDNEANDESQQTTTPPSAKKNLSSINSFEEWKQQQLQADLSKAAKTASQNSASTEMPPPSTSRGTSSSASILQTAPAGGGAKKGKLRKNFASTSCGAKVLAHNAEAQHVGSILSSSPDEYMLNPCNAKIWFVIELCESIRILNIEMANFELFSSVPKTLRVSASDRYPTKEWHRNQLGTFNVSFNRTIQSFQTVASTIYLKYVKFELLDFHGHEHYCPLSVVRVHGSNVEDEIMTMEDNTNLADLKSSPDIRDGAGNDDDDDDDVNVSNDQQVGGIIGSAILDLAKRVFRRPGTRDTLSTTLSPPTTAHVLKSDCHPAGLNGSMANGSINAWRHSDAFKQCVAEFLLGLWSNFDTCTIYLSQICFKSNYCCQCPLMSRNAAHKFHDASNKSIVSTLNLYANPCGYYHILTIQFACGRDKLIEANKTRSSALNHELTQDLPEKNVTIDQLVIATVLNETENSISNQSALNGNSTFVNESSTKLTQNRSNEQPLANPTPDESTLVLDSQTVPNSTQESPSPSPILESKNADGNVTDPSNEPDILEDSDPTITPTTTISPAILSNNEPMPPLISSPWLKGLLINTKSLPELFKIIEKLNFNLTLSNRYLQELSQHYVKKLDETQQTTDLLLKASKSADEKFENLEEQLIQLQSNFNDISYRLVRLEACIPLIVCTLAGLFFWCMWSTCRLIRVRRKLKYVIDGYEKLKAMKRIHSLDDDENDDDQEGTPEHPIVCNGTSKRKLSTDSSDSIPGRSQRVPDLTLSQILEKHEHRRKEKSSNPTRHLLSLSTI